MQRVFEALSSPVRREVLYLLAGGSMTAGDIAARFTLTKSTLSQHLSALQVAGLVEAERRGQFIHYSLARAPLVEAVGALLDRIGAESAPTSAADAPPGSETRSGGSPSYWRRMD
ncbi:MAG: metalloregulator ArsR/SmtB family transcription factor [Caulobacter sp.]|nr:metalloregulator ArsR/SmtB family transcription factor [Caulobacter sp.]